MDLIIHVFPSEYHLVTLQEYMASCANLKVTRRLAASPPRRPAASLLLEPSRVGFAADNALSAPSQDDVDVRTLLANLMDRLADFASEEEIPQVTPTCRVVSAHR